MTSREEPAATFAASDRAATGYRIFVRNLVVACRIGIRSHEKPQRQRVRVNAELEVAQAISDKDDFAEVLNYEAIVAGIKAIADAGHVNLVETFADRVLRLCLDDRRVMAVRVSVEKLDVYPEAESVGITIDYRR